MCGCATHQTDKATLTLPTDALTLGVRDMTCGHCAGIITKAVEAGIPGSRVEADPASRTVLVRGTGNLAAVEALITGAGYTPTAPTLG
ncbi:MAG TPA: heavy-metal-associated domain-containing protein [Microvirga sp.]|jgi:copper chaperone